MKPLVEFCASNVTSYSREVMEQLENDPELDADVIEYGCLGCCGECFMAPFALVNGDYVTAETPQALLDKIRDKIREEQA